METAKTLESLPSEQESTSEVRGFMIDPVTRTIVRLDYGGDYREITAALGCSLFDVARFNEHRDVAYIDDEGLLKNPMHFFAVNGYLQPLAGRGWILGTDEAGDSVTPTVDMKWLRANVLFYQILGSFSTKVLAEVMMADNLSRTMLCDIAEETEDAITKRFKDFAEMKETANETPRSD